MITSRAPGDLHVEVSWSTAYGDADVHLLSTTRVPDAGWFTVDDCYWANIGPDWGAAGAIANPTLDRDDTDGYGPENITIATSPLSGRYTVGVHYYCQHSIGMGAVAPGDGPTTATARVYCMGALIATYSGISLSRTDDFRVVASVDYPSCVGRSIDRLTNGSTVLPAGTRERHCEVPCAMTADCPRSDMCVLVGGGGPPRHACVHL